MKLHNTLTRTTENFKPLDAKGTTVTLYSCGPTVYDNIHIGNLSAFIMADTLRRTLVASGYRVKHVMNYTDVDDKTIRRSRERFEGPDPHQALKTLTDEYIEIFNADMERIGNDIHAMRFVRATGCIDGMKRLVGELLDAGLAYTADDGAYFSIAKYKKGHTYGQLTEVTVSSTANARIQNDEYDKESAQDFALWKTAVAGEPSWEFTHGKTKLDGRPGWHIECSVMSTGELGQPFDIHTGGVDLIFPHHENEIAQSTATRKDADFARFFVHNEHLLVDGRKMAKSLGNFYTLENVVDKGHDPLAFRLMMLQAHYRSQTNFTWENVQAAENRLNRWRNMAVLRWQPIADTDSGLKLEEFEEYADRLLAAMQDDMDTPAALAVVDEAFRVVDAGLPTRAIEPFTKFLQSVDSLLGLDLAAQPDIDASQKKLIKERLEAKHANDFAASDRLRDELAAEGIEIRDMPLTTLWGRGGKPENGEATA